MCRAIEPVGACIDCGWTGRKHGETLNLSERERERERRVRWEGGYMLKLQHASCHIYEVNNTLYTDDWRR